MDDTPLDLASFTGSYQHILHDHILHTNEMPVWRAAYPASLPWPPSSAWILEQVQGALAIPFFLEYQQWRDNEWTPMRVVITPAGFCAVLRFNGTTWGLCTAYYPETGAACADDYWRATLLHWIKKFADRTRQGYVLRDSRQNWDGTRCQVRFVSAPLWGLVGDLFRLDLLTHWGQP